MRERGLALRMWIVAGALVAPTLAWTAEADRVDASAGWLPSGRWEMASGLLHGKMYLAGGQDFVQVRDEVLVFDPAAGGAAQAASCRLPDRMSRMAYATDGASLFLFGGITATRGMSDLVLRITPNPANPLQCAVATAGRFPYPVAAGAAAWSGSVFYIFGGIDVEEDPLPKVFRFDPASGTVTDAEVASFWPPRAHAAAVWLNGRAYVIGGSNAYPLARIDEYDPAANAMTSRGSLPFLASPQPGRLWPSAVAAGEHVLVFGGEAWTTSPGDEIVRFHPATGERIVMSARLPTPRAGTTAVWNGTSALVAGGYGYNGNYTLTAQIVRYDVKPPAPTSVTAVSGPSPGEITLSWTPPPANTYLTLSGYRVLRSTLEDATAEQSVALDAPVGSSFVDRDLVPGIRYYYRVVAATPQGASPPSEESSTRAAMLPSGLELAGARPLADPDGDALPTPVESPVCGTNAVREIVNGMSPSYAGRCAGTNYTATAFLDEDDDGVLDRAEPWFCAATGDVELAGQCAASEYGVTPRSWSEIVASTLDP